MIALASGVLGATLLILRKEIKKRTGDIIALLAFITLKGYFILSFI